MNLLGGEPERPLESQHTTYPNSTRKYPPLLPWQVGTSEICFGQVEENGVENLAFLLCPLKRALSFEMQQRSDDQMHCGEKLPTEHIYALFGAGSIGCKSTICAQV